MISKGSMLDPPPSSQTPPQVANGYSSIDDGNGGGSGGCSSSSDVGQNGYLEESCCPQNQNTTHPNHRSPEKPSSNKRVGVAVVAEEKDKISESEETTSSNPIDDDDGDDENEPLGYQHFLCDVNIEYSPGGHLSSSDSNQHCFKMKYLPYMVKRASFDKSIDETMSSNFSLSDSSIRGDEDSFLSDSRIIRPIDVTKTTCAFLGNSEYVPNQKFNHRRVVLEMISAKLSQSTTFNVSVTNNHTTNLLTKQPERRLSMSRGGSSSVAREPDSTSMNSSSPDSSLNENQNASSSNNQHNSSPMTSKKFVNYTILIKTAPGLDCHPAVIERRFSDFLQLYQGLKQQSNLASTIDKHVTFPKKVYMGNFSVANIAERSIVFAKLLDLCMTNSDILWSAPFISFLLDKELCEAHRLSLCGDPEDVQALIETVYFIEKKIYFNWLSSYSTNSSQTTLPNSPEPSSNNEQSGCYSPALPRTEIAIQSSSSDDTTSAASSRSNNMNGSPSSTTTRLSPLQSVSDCGEDVVGENMSGKLSNALSQRVLVTFCILMLTYYRGENYQDLKLAIRDFSQLVTSQRFVESVAQTRHFVTLRACLLFLMNIHRGNVIDDNQRLWLKRRLEDIDGTYAEANDGLNDVISTSATNHSGQRTNNADVCRVTKGDLTSMLRDRNFCSFKDDPKSSR